MIKTFLLCLKAKKIVLPKVMRNSILILIDEFFDFEFDLAGNFKEDFIISKGVFYCNFEVTKKYMDEAFYNFGNLIQGYDCFQNDKYFELLNMILDSEKKNGVSFMVDILKVGYSLSCYFRSFKMMEFFSEELHKLKEIFDDGDDDDFKNFSTTVSIDDLETIKLHDKLFQIKHPLSSAISHKLVEGDFKIFEWYLEKYNNTDDYLFELVCRKCDLEKINYMIENTIDNYDAGFRGASRSGDVILALLLFDQVTEPIDFNLIVHHGNLEMFKIFLKKYDFRLFDLYYVISSIKNHEVRDYILTFHKPNLMNGKILAEIEGTKTYIEQASKLMEIYNV